MISLIKKTVVVLLIIFIIVFFILLQYNYKLSKEIKSFILTESIYYKFNSENLTFLKFNKILINNNVESKKMNISILKDNLKYKVIIKNYSYYYYDCQILSNVYFVKNNENSYNIMILPENKLNFSSVYISTVPTISYCNYNLEFDINNVLKKGDTVYIFDNNKVIKELIIS